MNPYQNLPAGKKLMAVIAVYIAVAFSIMLSSGGSTMLPVAAKEIGGMDIYTLALTIPGVIGIALMPLFGFLAAKNPAIRRPLFIIGYILAAIGIFIRGIAPNMWWIIISSALLGMYSPSIYVMGYTMIRDMYDRKQAGTYLGVVGTMQSIGLMVGPLLTGFLITSFSWRVVNFVIAPFFLLSAIFMFGRPGITKQEAKEMSTTSAKFDGAGAIATIAFLSGLILFLSLTKYAPFGSPLSFTFLGIAIIALISMILIIRKKGSGAFLPAPVLKDRNTLCFTISNFFTIVAAMSISIFMPVYILYVMKLPASTAGIVMAVYAVAGLFMGPIVGRMIGKAGTARGAFMFGSGLLRMVMLLALIIFLNPTTNIWIVYILMFISGFYSTFGGVSGAVGPMVQLKPEVRQQGNAIIQLGQNFGGSTSIAIYSAIMAMSQDMEKGFKTILIVACVACLFVIIAASQLKKLEAVPAAGQAN